MAERCFDLTEYQELLDLAPGDPRSAHLQACPLCRARLAAFRAFLAREPVAGSRPGEAADALERAVASIVAAGSARAPAGERRGLTDLVRTVTRRRVIVPTLAVAAAAALILTIQPGRRGPDRPSGILRLHPGTAVSAANLTATSEVLADGTHLLRWTSSPAAAAYRIQVFDANLTEIASFATGADTILALSPAQLPGDPSLLLWRVLALGEDGELAHSRPAVLRGQLP